MSIRSIRCDVRTVENDAGARALPRSKPQGSRKEAVNLRFDVLAEFGRRNRHAIIEAWRDASSFDAHDKAEGTANYHQLRSMRDDPHLRTGVHLSGTRADYFWGTKF